MKDIAEELWVLIVLPETFRGILLDLQTSHVAVDFNGTRISLLSPQEAINSLSNFLVQHMPAAVAKLDGRLL